MHISDYLANLVRDHILLGSSFPAIAQPYVGLGTAASKSSFTEVANGEYARLAASFSLNGASKADNDADIVFQEAVTAWSNLTHIGIFDAVSGGNMLYFSPISGGPKSISIGNRLKVPASSLVVSVSGLINNAIRTEILQHTLMNTAMSVRTVDTVGLATCVESDGSGYDEETDGSYSQQAGTFIASGANGVENSNAPSFTAGATAWEGLSHVLLFDGAEWVCAAALDSTTTLAPSQTMTFSAGDITHFIGD